jgi:D-2-hydroxyacid dehydrogenase (NADP+)
MPEVLLCTDTFWEQHGPAVRSVDASIDPVCLIDGQRVSDDDLERVTIAFWSPDTYPDRIKPFLRTALRAPNLRWLQSFFAGSDDPVFTTLRANGVTVTSAAGANATPIAQMVLAYLLAFGCDLARLGRAQSEHRWGTTTVVELAGKRLGIVGLGSIGAEVARLAHAHGMDVIGLRRTVTGGEPCTTWTDDRLAELLAWADVIVVAAPLTDRTRRLLGAEQFAAMRPGVWFVNVGRGEVVDEVALVSALESGHVAAAGLDVFAVEPLPHDSPLWDMPNVIVTPHVAGSSEPSDRRAVEMFIENLGRYTRGEPLRNVTLTELSH